jgi:hypothetical protein
LSSFYFAKFMLSERERPPMVIFQLDVVQNWPNKLLQKPMDEKLSPSVTQRSPLLFIHHTPTPATFRG